MVISKLKKAAVALALLSTFGAANALTTTFGTLESTVGIGDRDFVGSFNDTYSFTAGSLPGVLGSIAAFDFKNVLTVKYSVGVGSDPVWSTFASVPLEKDIAFPGFASYTTSFNSLKARETYWINLVGTASGSQGVYSFTLTSVPEPESYALLLAGLGMVGTIVSRRRSKSTI